MYRHCANGPHTMSLFNFVHNTLFVFFGTSAVVSAAAYAGADPRRAAVIVGAIVYGATSGTAFFSESASEASNPPSADLFGILLSVALAFWMKWRVAR